MRMGVWATVNGIRAKVLECVVEWDGEEHFRVRYAKDSHGESVKEGIPGVAAPWMIAWDGLGSPRLVPIRRTAMDENLTQKEIWDLERQWGG